MQIACNSGKENREITTLWEDKKAIGIVIPQNLVRPLALDSRAEKVQVRLISKNEPVGILGEFMEEKESIIFRPLIPFTRGSEYKVLVAERIIGKFRIPTADPADAPALLAIYPTADSLPENLLKIHLYFSNPMRETQSARYVTLVKNENDTVAGAFLDLQPELWNEARTMLTLWLDPGRIKRDLIPNKTLGAPLKKHEHYNIIVSANWQNQQGLKLKKQYTKAFVTKSRDEFSPKPDLWEIKSPKNGTRDALNINFKESLDFTLLSEALSILAADKKMIMGNWRIKGDEKTAIFSPDQRWSPGTYSLRIETRLEDLAGNNLHRPFDRDITQKQTTVNPTKFVTLPFLIAE